MMENSVYVSYAWKVEEQIKIVARLEQACRERGIKLLRDKNELPYKGSIRDYMDELAAGDAIILVLSEDYFKSRDCMYELFGARKSRKFPRQVFPIVVRGTPLRAPEERLDYLFYWKEKHRELEQKLSALGPTYTEKINKSLNEYAEYRRKMDEMLDEISDWNMLSEDVHIETDFKELLDLIQPPGKASAKEKPRFHRTADKHFKKTIRDNIGRELPLAGSLHQAMQKEAAAVGMTGDLAEAICRTPLEEVIPKVLYPATRKALDELERNSTEFEAAWSVAKAVLGWLSLMAVDDDWVAAQETAQGEELSFEILVETACGTEVVSSRYRQVRPRLSAEPGRPDVGGDDSIDIRLDTGWSDEFALETLLVEIWNTVFPKQMKDSISLDPESYEVRMLKRTLQAREKNKYNHYYIPVEKGGLSHLNRREFHRQLTGILPEIAVIYLLSKDGSPALLVADELMFMTEIREFLNLIHDYRRR